LEHVFGYVFGSLGFRMHHDRFDLILFCPSDEALHVNSASPTTGEPIANYTLSRHPWGIKWTIYHSTDRLWYSLPLYLLSTVKLCVVFVRRVYCCVATRARLNHLFIFPKQLNIFHLSVRTFLLHCCVLSTSPRSLFS